MSDLASYVGGTYAGDMVDGKYHGVGTYTAASGVQYQGCFREGEFHGAGKLVFPSGAVYEAMWEHGLEVPGSGRYAWADGLVYGDSPSDSSFNPASWTYLTHDRRFWREVVADTRKGHDEMQGAGVAGDGEGKQAT